MHLRKVLCLSQNKVDSIKTVHREKSTIYAFPQLGKAHGSLSPPGTLAQLCPASLMENPNALFRNIFLG